MDGVEVAVRSGHRRVVDVTDDVLAFCRDRGDGLCHVFAPHATAGLALMETGSGSEADLEDALERWLPHDDRYRHHHGSPGHGADHLLPALVAPFLVLVVRDGRPVLGTWQSVVFVDPNVDNTDRRLLLHFLAG